MIHRIEKKKSTSPINIVYLQQQVFKRQSLHKHTIFKTVHKKSVQTSLRRGSAAGVFTGARVVQFCNTSIPTNFFRFYTQYVKNKLALAEGDTEGCDTTLGDFGVRGGGWRGEGVSESVFFKLFPPTHPQ
jgi:hypothetical protein